VTRALLECEFVGDESLVALPTATLVGALGDGVGFRGREGETQRTRRARMRLGAHEESRCDASAARARSDEEIFENPDRALRECRIGGEEMREGDRVARDTSDVEHGFCREALGDESRRALEIDRRFVEEQILAKERDDLGEIIGARALDRQATNFGSVARMRSIAVWMASSEFA
jgi:hypothetical protein